MTVAALQSQLRSLRRQVETLPDDTYSAVPGRTSGSIGQHVRHVLDHVRALVVLGTGDEFTYDARLRGTRVETDPVCAADEIVRLCVEVEDLDDVPFDRPVRLHLVTDATPTGTEVMTTVGREVAYVTQHTIHHCALIAVLLERSGLTPPPRFGCAPSTPTRA